jgi:stage III sporulation protein SpoIIIAA
MKTKIAEQIEAIKTETGTDEAVLLAEAMRRGVQLMYQEQMVSKYLEGRLKRGTLIRLIGQEAVEEMDERKQAIDEDFDWGTRG